MDDAMTKVAAAPIGSCCSLSNAPVPAMQQKATELSLALVPVAVLDVTWKVPNTKQQRSVQIERTLFLPALQSLLCTFLI